MSALGRQTLGNCDNHTTFHRSAFGTALARDRIVFATIFNHTLGVKLDGTSSQSPEESSTWVTRSPFLTDPTTVRTRHLYYRNLAEACENDDTSPLTGRPLNLAQMTAQSWPSQIPAGFALLRLESAGRQFLIPAEMNLQLKETLKYVRVSTGNSSFTERLSDSSRGPLKISRAYAQAADEELGLTGGLFQIQDSFPEANADDDGPDDAFAAVNAGRHTEGVDPWLVSELVPLVSVASNNRQAVFDRHFNSANAVQEVFEKQINVLGDIDYNEEGSSNYDSDRPVVSRPPANLTRATRREYLLGVIRTLGKPPKTKSISGIVLPGKTTSGDASALRAASAYEANARYIASEVTRITCGAVNPASDSR